MTAVFIESPYHIFCHAHPEWRSGHVTAIDRVERDALLKLRTSRVSAYIVRLRRRQSSPDHRAFILRKNQTPRIVYWHLFRKTLERLSKRNIEFISTQNLNARLFQCITRNSILSN